MKFRDIEVDEIKIIEGTNSTELEKTILALEEKYIVVDLQYSTRIEWNSSNDPYRYMTDEGIPILFPTTIWSVLALLRKK